MLFTEPKGLFIFQPETHNTITFLIYQPSHLGFWKRFLSVIHDHVVDSMEGNSIRVVKSYRIVSFWLKKGQPLNFGNK